MAAISGANPIVASDVNNFTGELFKITPHRTPLLAAAGGLNGGNAINSTFFQFQTQDNAVITAVTPDDEGGSPNYSGRSRASQQGVLQIFHEAAQVSYTAQAASGEIVPFDLAGNYKNSDPALALAGTSPINDELVPKSRLIAEGCQLWVSQGELDQPKFEQVYEIVLKKTTCRPAGLHPSRLPVAHNGQP